MRVNAYEPSFERKRNLKRCGPRSARGPEKALISDAKALVTWQYITPLGRNEWICWIELAKKPETRSRTLRTESEDPVVGLAARIVESVLGARSGHLSANGTKPTYTIIVAMSASDPKRTCTRMCPIAYSPGASIIRLVANTPPTSKSPSSRSELCSDGSLGPFACHRAKLGQTVYPEHKFQLERTNIEDGQRSALQGTAALVLIRTLLVVDA